MMKIVIHLQEIYDEDNHQMEMSVIFFVIHLKSCLFSLSSKFKLTSLNSNFVTHLGIWSDNPILIPCSSRFILLSLQFKKSC